MNHSIATPFTTNMSSGAPAPDLVERMRRPSTDSISSTYSFISEAPSVHSLDSNGEFHGEPILSNNACGPISSLVDAMAALSGSLSSMPDLEGPSEFENPHPSGILITEASQDPLSGQQAVEALGSLLPSPDGQITRTTPLTGQAAERLPYTVYGTATTPAVHDDGDSLSTPSLVSHFWSQFPNFMPQPKASFKSEFGRLAKSNGWNAKTQRKRKIEALNAEFDFHYGTCMTKLDRWQQLVKDVGIETAPDSITKCKKALRPVLINLYNLLDHRRSPVLKVRRFKSHSEFAKYTCKGKIFPKECAKQDGFIKVLLKEI